MTNCCVVGLGYIGLPTAIILAQLGNKVCGVDINSEIVSKVNKGFLHFEEPGLEKLLIQVIKDGFLSACSKPVEADVFLIAVPTPTDCKKNGIPNPNIDYVLDAANQISNVIKPGNIVLIESTCPVGTTEKVAKCITDLSGLTNDQIFFAYCPERVFPGNILYELINNNRIVGGYSEKSTIKAKDFYSKFCRGVISSTDCRTAEMVKLTENAFRDVNIAFANELSIVCSNLEIDVLDVIEKSNFHPRVNILQPSCGVGGHCIAIDPWFIAAADPKRTQLIQTARSVNNNKTIWCIDKIIERADILAKKFTREPIIGCFGLTFKPDVDDLRESPALLITNQLIINGLSIIACEPNLDDHCSLKLESVDFTLKNADLYVILVAHSEFKIIDFSQKDCIDFCGVTKVYE